MGDYIVKIGTKKQINDHVKELKKVLPDVEVTDNKQAKTLKVMHNGIKVMRFDKALSRLLKEYGYKVEGRLLISIGVRGFTSDRVFRSNVSSLFDACEQLIPIISEDSFYFEFKRITK